VTTGCGEISDASTQTVRFVFGKRLEGSVLSVFRREHLSFMSLEDGILDSASDVKHAGSGAGSLSAESTVDFHVPKGP